MSFKVGDYVRVKPDAEGEHDYINWAGEIMEADPKHNIYTVKLDAATLDLLGEDYVLQAEENGEDYLNYNFYSEDLELHPRRDTDAEYEAAVNRLHDMVPDYEKEEEDMYFDTVNAWIDAFEKDPLFQTVKEMENDEGDARFVCENFTKLMYNHISVSPYGWQPEYVEEVCLDILPRKLSAEPGLFEIYGDVLIAFFTFLGKEGHQQYADDLVQRTKEIKDQIPIEVNNPDKWGMAKSFMMMATNDGVDISDEAQLNAFFMRYNQGVMRDLREKEDSPEKPPKIKNAIVLGEAQHNPYKHLGRNDKITVKYEDGTIKKEVKFKKVKADLLAGKCELIS